MIRSHLAQANRYIAEMRAEIARERVMVEHALDAGYPSEVAESMLHTLEEALRIFEKASRTGSQSVEAPTVGIKGHPSARPAHSRAGRRAGTCQRLWNRV